MGLFEQMLIKGRHAYMSLFLKCHIRLIGSIEDPNSLLIWMLYVNAIFVVVV